VFTAYWKGSFDLYLLDVEQPITESVTVSEQQLTELRAVRTEDLPRFEPSIEVTLDDANRDRYGGFRFYLQNVFGGNIGVSDDQTFIAQIGFEFANFLGDRRIIALFESIESFQNFDVFYVDNTRRLGKVVRIFDNRDFYVGFDSSRGDFRRLDSALKLTGLTGSVVYPLGVNHRLMAGVGYIFREIDFQSFLRDPEGNLVIDPETGFAVPIILPREDDFPQIEAAMVGDTSVMAPWGGISGRRWRIFGSYAPDLDDTGDSSSLTTTYGLDVRQYITVTRRSNFAVRLWGAASDGNFPTPLYIGGLDTIRGFDFRSLVGDRAFFGNFEFRFPLIDALVFPVAGVPVLEQRYG
jgi:hypothetical protein